MQEQKIEDGKIIICTACEGTGRITVITPSIITSVKTEQCLLCEGKRVVMIKLIPVDDFS